MRPDLEHIEQKLNELLAMLTPMILLQRELENHLRLTLSWAQETRIIVDNYQANANPADAELLERLDKLFAEAINTISDLLEFPEDLSLIRLDLNRMERQVQRTIKIYVPGKASVDDAKFIRQKFEAVWTSLQEKASTTDEIDEDTMERLRDVYIRLFQIIDQDIQSR